MSGTDHEDIHRDLGAYVLGALEPAERDRLERHLSSCAICRDELADLAVLPVLLSRVTSDVLAAVESPPSFEPIARQLAADRRRARRRERAFAAVAGIAAVVAAVAVLAGPVRTDDAAGRSLVSGDGRVTATLEERAWGMSVQVAASGLPDRPGYVVVAVARDGHRAQVATWSNTGGDVRVTGACYLDAEDVDRVEIVAAPDEEVLAVLSPG